MKNEWTKEWPKEEGMYWFYGELYRPVSQRPEPKIELVNVQGPTANNHWMYVANGQFVSEHEGMQGLWKRAILPLSPKIWKYHWQERYFWCNNSQCCEYRKNWKVEWILRQEMKSSHYVYYHCKHCFSKLEPVLDDLSIFPKEEKK